MRTISLRFLLLSLMCILFVPVFGQEKVYTAFSVKVVGKGKPVILVPGATCGGAEWDSTVFHLQKNYECHVLTLAGYAGCPPLPGPPYLQTYKDQLEQYIVDKHLQHVTLIGHSIGGVICMWLASEMNVRLEKILIVDAMPFFAAAQNPDAKPGYRPEQAEAMYATYKNMDDAQFHKGQLSMARFLCKDSTHWDQLVAWGQASDRKTMAYTMTEMMSKDLRAAIAGIRVPTLVLAAFDKNPQYPSFTRDVVSKMFNGQYSECKKCMVHVSQNGTRHFIMYDDPKWYFSELEAFLEH